MILAVASAYATGAVCGEAFVTEALERFFDDILAAGRPPEAVPGEAVIEEYLLDFVRVLGRRTARLHTILAAVPGPDFAPEPVTKLYLRSIYQAMRNHVHHAGQAVDAARRKGLAVPALPRKNLLERFAPLLSLPPGGSRIRIHGDLQLENLLRAGRDLVFTDFDGDVRLPLGERRIKRSPLRDVASLLLSITVTARREYDRRVAQVPAEGPLLLVWLETWLETVRGEFLSAYLDAIGDAAFLPPDVPSRRVLLDVFLLEQWLRAILRDLDGDGRDVPLLLDTLEGVGGVVP
jgi:maltose alpha-D-glucosyltransferase/alpha-amylase